MSAVSRWTNPHASHLFWTLANRNLEWVYLIHVYIKRYRWQDIYPFSCKNAARFYSDIELCNLYDDFTYSGKLSKRKSVSEIQRMPTFLQRFGKLYSQEFQKANWRKRKKWITFVIVESGNYFLRTCDVGLNIFISNNLYWKSALNINFSILV